METDIKQYLMKKCDNSKTAWKSLSVSSGETRNNALRTMAETLIREKKAILDANKADIDKAREAGYRESLIDRLMLNDSRIDGMAASMVKVANLPDPLGSGEVHSRPNGLIIKKVHVPIGNIGIIYEARPNVTADAAALCVKSGNTVILKGGKEAENSNEAITAILQTALKASGLSENCVQSVGIYSREATNELMKLNGYIDLLIPRGGRSLIRAVVDNATVPVIETGAGNCHVYVEKTANFEMAGKILKNAKMQRPSVCNAAECLLVDAEAAADFLPLAQKLLVGVELRGCERTCAVLPDIKAATEEDYYTEYNDYIMSVKVVNGVEAAVSHINKYNTGHSEAIITSDIAAADYFTANVDAAAVYVNASTRFTDGEEFGFGAEIGISTQKYHARGPMGLNELTTVKYIINGNGQIR